VREFAEVTSAAGAKGVSGRSFKCKALKFGVEFNQGAGRLDGYDMSVFKGMVRVVFPSMT